MFVCKSSAAEPMPSRASSLLQTITLLERSLPAKNDNAVYLINRSVCIAGKHRSHRGTRCCRDIALYFFAGKPRSNEDRLWSHACQRAGIS